MAVSKPKKLAHPPKIGRCVVNDVGRRSTGKVVEVGPRSMYVRFDNGTELTLIYFNDPEWGDYITVERVGQPNPASEAEAEGQPQE